ncbi:unnamed protein product [Dicrocoelium dendriticum]|nr:unnamed protein product [Dicrocoelium dendriticum]
MDSDVDIGHTTKTLDKMRQNLTVTRESEQDNCLTYLDVLIIRRPDGSTRSVYRTCQYLHYTSFSPIQHKRSLVWTLFYRAHMICTPDIIKAERDLFDTLQSNGYPLQFIKCLSEKTKRDHIPLLLK